jgi:hypothetical protein
MKNITQTITTRTYQYTQDELRDRIHEFNRDITHDFIQEAISLLEDMDVENAVGQLQAIPTMSFDEMNVNDIMDEMYFAVLFPEPIEDHYHMFIKTPLSAAEKQECKKHEKLWLDLTYIEIVNYDGGEVLHRIKMKDASW